VLLRASVLLIKELEGVIALSHVKNFDMRLMGVVAILVGLLQSLPTFYEPTVVGRKKTETEQPMHRNIL